MELSAVSLCFEFGVKIFHLAGGQSVGAYRPWKEGCASLDTIHSWNVSSWRCRARQPGGSR
jgi:hypothetical protein